MRKRTVVSTSAFPLTAFEKPARDLFQLRSLSRCRPIPVSPLAVRAPPTFSFRILARGSWVFLMLVNAIIPSALAFLKIVAIPDR